MQFFFCKQDQRKESPASAPVAGQNLIVAEKAEVGGVRWSVYLYYMRCIGITYFTVSCLLMVGYQGFQVRYCERKRLVCKMSSKYLRFLRG